MKNRERKRKSNRYYRIYGEWLGYPKCCIEAMIQDRDNKRFATQDIYTCNKHRMLTNNQIWKELIGREPYSFADTVRVCDNFKVKAGLITQKEYNRRLNHPVYYQRLIELYSD